ncbi:MAG: beta-N-acetylhexosaminidase [Clostridia bacterium]|nr:beta-N-acetylhexosaminidase [Clostridia bacterium]
MQKICFRNLPKDWEKGTEALLPQLSLAVDATGIPVTVEVGKGLSVTSEAGGVHIVAEGKKEYFRALSYLPGKLAGKADVEESCKATMLCLMADVSRNAVMNVASVKRMIRYLALMGMDSLMLYAEDTYELPGYPYFGRMRGRYSKEELKEIDDYAFELGIEVIPCIQTLAHLMQALQWKAFGNVHDIDDIMLVGEEKTYEMVDAMLKVCRECFRSPRINLGMDEAHNLGRGKYLDKNGYRKSTDIMLEHLERVVDLCRQNGYQPMIWSDMFFRMAFGGKYYVEEGEISEEVMAKVPEGLTLIFWDYYTTERTQKRFSHMLDCHKKFHNPTAFAGGAWAWSGFAPHSRFSIKSTELQLDACYKYSMTDQIVTCWGDNGRECTNFACLTTLLYYAEYAYGGKPCTEKLEARAQDCFGIGFEDLLTLDAPDAHANEVEHPLCPTKYLLFNDPIEGLLDAHMDPTRVAADYAEAEKQLLAFADHKEFGYIYKSLAALCRVLTRKSDFTVRLRAAYLSGEKGALAALAEELDVIVADLDAFLAVYREQWYCENKSYGFSVQELRIGGLRARLLSAKARIEAYLADEANAIPELLEPVLPMLPIGGDNPYVNFNNWRRSASACIL